MTRQQIAAAERTLPHNLEAERSVIGALLVGRPWTDVCDSLAATDFFRDAHRRIYEAMGRLAARGVTFDFVTLKNELARTGELDDVGGPAYVSSLADGVPRSTNIEYYAGVVREKAVRRDLIYAANKILTESYGEDHETADAALDAAERAVLEVAQRREGRGEVIDTATLMRSAFEVVERVANAGSAVTGLTTGLVVLDRETRGMHPGQLIVLAARPGEGKSTLMLNIARRALVPTVVFSLEMDREELGVRLMVSEAQVNGHLVQSGCMRSVDYGRISAAMESVGTANLLVDDTAYRTVSQIRSLSRKLKSQKNIGLICIDYLQLLGTGRERDSRRLELADMTRSLKLLAKELRVPVLLLSQLNRDTEKLKRRPQLSDLAESGATEQDADQVWFIHALQGDENEGLVELIVAKSRSGPRAIVRAAYLKEQYRFADLAPQP